MIVRNVKVIDRFHHNGDPFWDGDQTLYELDISDGNDQDVLLAVVPRGNAFISAQKVARHVERLGVGLAEFRLRARKPAPDWLPQIALPIEPGEE